MGEVELSEYERNEDKYPELDFVNVRVVGLASGRDELMTLAKERAPDPSVFEDREPFFWRMEASNGSVDSYFTHMLPSTLRNFAEDAAAGVPFMNAHKTGGFRDSEQPLGHTLTGAYVDGRGGSRTRFEADAFMLPGLAMNGVKTDEFIDGIRSGTLKSNSVGFNPWDGAKYICSIDGEDMLDWNAECYHIPGVKYPKDGAKKKKGKNYAEEDMVLCTAGIDNARLSEISGVWKGATPGAVMLKIHREAEAGRITREDLLLLEQRHRIHLPGQSRRSWRGADLTPPGEKDMLKEKEEEGTTEGRSSGDPPAGEFVSIPAAEFREAGFDPAQDFAAQVGALRGDVERLKNQDAAVTRILKDAGEGVTLEVLGAQAADGRAYRTDLVKEALEEGVRAQGSEFASGTYEELLKSAPVATIRRMRSDWQKIGDTLLGGGGRKSQDEPPAAPKGDKQHRPENYKVV